MTVFGGPGDINKLIKLAANSIPDNQLFFAATFGRLTHHHSYVIQKEPMTMQNLLTWL